MFSSKTAIGLVSMLAMVLAACVPARAQDLEPSVSPSPVGSGARAAGMANAFVAIADDATAASWNPAGLVQLERPELSIVGAYNRVFERFDSDSRFPEVGGDHDSDSYEINYLSYVHPLPFLVLGRNVTVSINYQQKYDFTRDFSLRFNQNVPLQFGAGPSRIFNQRESLRFEQRGSLSTISPALAFEITPRLSFGVALNVWRSSFIEENSWEQRTRNEVHAFAGGSGSGAIRDVRERFDDFEGENWTLGLLWEINEHWKVGARYDTAFSGDVDYEKRGFTARFPNASRIFASEFVREDRTVHFPDSIALGVAYRFNDRLTVALDVTRTDWNDFYMKEGNGTKRSLIDGSDLGNPRERTKLDPTYTVRFGAEYVFVPREPRETLNRLWTVRGGLFYDEEPATGADTTYRVPLPSTGLSNIRSVLNSTLNGRSGDPDKFYGVAVGLGVQLHQRVNLDAAYQFRYGPGVNGDLVRGVPEFEEDFHQHRFLFSAIVYF